MHYPCTFSYMKHIIFLDFPEVNVDLFQTLCSMKIWWMPSSFKLIKQVYNQPEMKSSEKLIKKI